MEPPESLPARVFLLAFDPHRKRMGRRTYLGLTLRAAALVDLGQRGLIDDEDDRVRVKNAGRLGDPLLDAVLREVSGARRRWRRWVAAGANPAYRTVRDQLATGGWIRVEERRFAGLIPYRRLEVNDWRARERLAARVAAALDASRPVARVDPRDRALVALVAVGEVLEAFPRSMWRAHRDRVDGFAAAAGPALPALRSAIRAVKAGDHAAMVGGHAGVIGG